MKKLLPLALGLVLVFAPVARAGDEEEELVKKLIDAVMKTAEQEEEQALDRTPAPEDKGDAEAIRAIQRRLDTQRVTVNFDGATLEEALDFIRSVTSMNLVVTPKAAEAAEGKKIKLRLKEVKLRNVLELVLQQVADQLRYAVRHEALQIGTSEEWKGKDMVLDFIPIDEFLVARPDFPADVTPLHEAINKKNVKGR